MNTLLMDTSSRNMLVALDVSGKLYVSEKYNTPKHLETLMPAVDGLLRQKDFTIANLDYLGVVIGPGSFTGIRIAVSSAKAMMMVNTKLKAVAVNSMELLATSYAKATGDSEQIAVVIPTTIKKVYYATFENGVRTSEDCVVEIENLRAISQELKIVSPVIAVPDATIYEVTEQDFANFVNERVEKETFVDTLSPCYIGLSQAEEQFNKKENK